MNENPAYVCICGIFFVPLRRFAQGRQMIDYQLTSDGLYAYRWPRASVTADAVQVLEIHG